MSDLKQLAAMTALNNMMSKPYFDICTIDGIGRMLDINAKGEAYDLLRTLHCVDWARMPTELRDAVPDLIKQCLGVAPVYQFRTLEQEVIDVSPARKLLRLFGSKP